MIFVDSNVPMYLIGGAHPHKTDAIQAVQRLVHGSERLVTSAEVLQEILHRYVAIRRPGEIQPAFDMLLGLVDEVFPIEGSDVEAAKQVVGGLVALSARDALHVAVMRRRGISEILSFDRGFDGVPGLVRLSS